MKREGDGATPLDALAALHAHAWPGNVRELDHAIERVTKALGAEGFGILTRIDMHSKIKEKTGKDIVPTVILGACNPQLAHRALKLEDKIGTMLPCNVIVQQHEGGGVEVSAVDPVASMMAVGNPKLAPIAGEVIEAALR